MVGTLLAADDRNPSKNWYDTTHRQLARQGLRVLALAYAVLDPTIPESVPCLVSCPCSFHLAASLL